MGSYTDEQDLLEAFKSFQLALISSDVVQLDRLLAPGYRGYNLRGGLEDRRFVLEAWSNESVSMDEFSFDNLRVEIRGDVGILTGNGYVAGTFQDEPWEHHIHFCDLYMKTTSGWQVFLSHTLEVEPSPPAFDPDELGCDG